MKKTTRSLLISALILFCTGLLLALSSSLYAILTHQKIFDVEKKDKKIESVTIGIEEILAHSPDSNFVKKLSAEHFTKIDLTSFAGDIEICGNTKKTELVLDDANMNNLKCTIKGGTLKIEEVDPVGFCGIYIGKNGLSFKGLRHIFSPGNQMNAKRTITLNVAKEMSLKEVSIQSYVGDVELKKVDAQKIIIESSFGNVKLKKLQNKDGKITVNGNFTDVNILNSKYSSCTVDVKVGDIKAELLDQIGQSTILDIWCGNAKVKTKLPTSFYKLSLSTSLGSVIRNNKSCGKKLSDSGSTASRISSGIILGNISVSYNGKGKLDLTELKEETEKEPETTGTVSSGDIETSEQEAA